MKPQNRHKLTLYRVGKNRGCAPRWLLINVLGNMRTYKTYKRARQAMDSVVFIAWDDDDK